MTKFGCAGIGIGALVLCGTAFAGQDFDRYREFTLGSDVATVSTATGIEGSAMKVLHQRPALIQEFTWRPRYARRQTAAENESAEQVVFTFYDDSLFRITVDYDQARTEGLSDTDMIDAISTIYGSIVKPSTTRRAPPASVYDDPGTFLAQWGDAANSVTLYKLTSYATKFRMVVTAEPTAALARTATARALVLDDREAPQREAAREKKEADDRRAAEEKARSTNKPAFRP